MFFIFKLMGTIHICNIAKTSDITISDSIISPKNIKNLDYQREIINSRIKIP
tara:strand:+ start:268 stop:423 length:156 start_codon:yes stop_codon:yes gene_type:complete